jgi:hypothetical protein
LKNTPPTSELTEAVRSAIWSFRVDAITAEVSEALRKEGVSSIVLKGPTIATWLYARDRPRLYTDSDLLIRQDDWDMAVRVVEELGFGDALGSMMHPRMESGSSYPWRRERDGAELDLHFTLFGLGASPARVWSVLAGEAEDMHVGGASVRALSRRARLLHIALHAVQHGGPRAEKPMMDLERALALAARGEWASAASLAVELDATPPFATGLDLIPAGRALANDLRIEGSSSTLAALRLGAVPLSEGFEELRETRGVRGKARLLLRELVPTPAFMRWRYPTARRGWWALALTYPVRWLWLMAKAIPGFIAWHRVRRTGSG